MALADYLGQLPPTNIPDMSGINASLAANALSAPAQPAPPQQPAAPAYKRPSFIQNLLGAIGDGLLVANGHQAVYAPRMAQRREGSALAQFLGTSDPTITSLAMEDPNAALELYKIKHPAQPDFIRDMIAANIDPASDQGQQILAQHFNSGQDASIREYQFAKGQGFQGSYMDFLNAKGGPLIANNGDGTFTLVPRAMGAPQGVPATQGMPTVSNPNDARKLPPGTKFRMPDGRIGTVPGGATASTPSLTFR